MSFIKSLTTPREVVMEHVDSNNIKDIIERINKKFEYIDSIQNLINDGKSENITGDIANIKSVNDDICSMILLVNLKACSKDQVEILNGFVARYKDLDKAIKNRKPLFKTVYVLEKADNNAVANNIVEKLDKALKSAKEETSSIDTTSNADQVRNEHKTIHKISKKIAYLDKLIAEFQSGKCADLAGKKQQIKQLCVEITNSTPLIDNSKFNDEEIKVIIMASDKVLNAIKIIEPGVPANNQATAAANNIGYGFNISNFIKQPQPQQPAIIQGEPKQMKTVFPHQMCGLTQEQIIAEVNKHFKVIETLDAYPLYDLLQNKLLSKKMKELDSKQRANNPYLTQVKMDEYIGEPKLLEQYKLCFTMPCNDKKQLIVVLFNPVPVPNKNGILEYPLHIFKAKKTAAYK